MSISDQKTVAGVAALMMQVYPKEEDFTYHFRKLVMNVQIATMLMDVADSFMRDADVEMEKCQIKSNGNIHKMINKVRNHITAIAGIIIPSQRINFTGSEQSVERSEDMSENIYNLIRASIDHTDDGAGFSAILNGIKRRKLHRHIFER